MKSCDSSGGGVAGAEEVSNEVATEPEWEVALVIVLLESASMNTKLLLATTIFSAQ